MTVAQNLCPNPALANNDTGWVPTPAGSYARATAVDASLPRTTGYAGSAIADINSPRYQTTPGQQYVISVSMHAIAAQSFGLLSNWYNASSGGSFVSATGNVSVSLAAGATTRVVLGPYTAPAGSVSGHLKFNDIDAGGIEITAFRCAPYTGDLTADGAYLDGNSPGAQWDGTAGSSTSAIRSFTDTATFASTWGNVSTVVAGYTPVTDSVAAGDSFAAVATGPITDGLYFVDGFLVASLSFDAKRGRVRIDAFTFAPGVTHAVVSRRDASGKYQLIRGGNVPTIAGRFSRTVDDYEYAAGEDAEYLIEGRTDTELTVQRATLKRLGAGDKTWLKFVAAPRYNRRINLVGWSKIRRRARAGHFDVKGRSAPVVTSDVHASRLVTVQFITRDQGDTDALDLALGSGIPIYLQVPKGVQLPTLYASVGDYEFGEPSKLDSGHALFSVPLTEISAPSAAVLGSLNSYLSVATDNRTYDELLSTYDTYERLAAS